MAQTTGAISFRNVKVEISTNGTTWTDISGFANELSLGGGDRQLAETFTADGDTPILTAGKRGALDVGVKALYTEGTSDPFEVVRAAYENGTSLYVRWSPKGGASGNFQYVTDAGYVSGAPYPVGNAGSADAVPLAFTVKVPKVTKSVVA